MAQESSSPVGVTAILEDFKAHWQSLLQIEAEVSRWTTVYAGALVLGIGASFNNSVSIGRDPRSALEHPISAAGILMLAAVNAVYILALAFKGYQCQLLRIYLYEVIGAKLRQLADESFNSWELWQRCAFSAPDRRGKPEGIRFAYYATQTLLPLTVSVLLLYLFWRHALEPAPTLRAGVGFGAVVAINIVATWFALSTTTTNDRWRQIVERDSALRESTEKQAGAATAVVPPAN